MADNRRGRPGGLARLRGDARAFTLVEIILVLLILTVIAGLSAPNLRKSLTQHQFEKSAEELHNVMRYAQSRAITKGRPVRLVFNDEFTGFWLTEDAGEAEAIVDSYAFERISGRMGTTWRLPAEISIRTEADISGLTFYADGRMDKVELAVCKQSRCKVISTKIQRGFIRSFESEDYT